MYEPKSLIDNLNNLQVLSSGEHSLEELLGMASDSLVHCPKCRKQITAWNELDFLDNVGVCAECDHLMSNGLV